MFKDEYDRILYGTVCMNTEAGILEDIRQKQIDKLLFSEDAYKLSEYFPVIVKNIYVGNDKTSLGCIM
jgi:hypothetical protein